MAGITSSRSIFRAGIGDQPAPLGDRLVPLRPLRRKLAALEIGKGGFVRSDHAGACARLDAHVADRHAAFHAQRADREPAYSITYPVAPSVPMRPMMPRSHVLRGHAVGQLAFDGDAESLGLRLRQALRCHHVLDFRGADPKASAPKAPCVEVCESPQTIVMPGLVNPSSGPMTWTMPWFGDCDVIKLDAEVGAVLAQRVDLLGRDRVFDDEAVWLWSGRCGRPWRRCGRDGAACVRPGAGLQRPAEKSPHGPGAGRYRGASARRQVQRPDAIPRLFQRVFWCC